MEYRLLGTIGGCGRLTGCASCGDQSAAARGLRAGSLRQLVAAER